MPAGWRGGKTLYITDRFTRPKVYVLVQAETGAVGQLLRCLRAQFGAEQVQQVIGPYDIVAIIEAARPGDECSRLCGIVSSLPGVERVVSLATRAD